MQFAQRHHTQDRTPPARVARRWGELTEAALYEIEAMSDLGMSDEQIAAYYGVSVVRIRLFREPRVRS